jgi:prevent-host-death family protein
MIVNIREAKARLLEPVERAEAGEEIIIGRRKRPVIRMLPAERSIEPVGAPDADRPGN